MSDTRIFYLSDITVNAKVSAIKNNFMKLFWAFVPMEIASKGRHYLEVVHEDACPYNNRTLDNLEECNCKCELTVTNPAGETEYILHYERKESNNEK